MQMGNQISHTTRRHTRTHTQPRKGSPLTYSNQQNEQQEQQEQRQQQEQQLQATSTAEYLNRAAHTHSGQTY